MKQFYLLIVLLTLFSPIVLPAQPCTLTATFKSYDSRCAATGAIKIIPSGGSGAYKYRVFGPVNLNYTTADSITGLAAGNYNIEVMDINTGCQFTGYAIHVGGSYSDPRFTLKTTDVSCDNGNNGKIEVENVQNGRGPFTYSIVAPSAFGVGTLSATGVFTDLPAGNYSIRLTDSCGGIQTRATTVGNYAWTIEGHTIARTSCDNASGLLKVKDSRGNYSYTSGIAGMMYGITKTPGDTAWSSNPNLSLIATGITSATAVAKDACGIVKSVSISLAINPSIGPNIAIDQRTCNTFRASVNAIQNMYAPNFKLIKGGVFTGTQNATGVFPGLVYGTYSIEATDACTGITFTRTFTADAPKVSVANVATISDKSCNTFTARITGQTNTTNPTYRLLDNNGVQVAANSTGEFKNLAYGSYCIAMKDGCIDTTITRCFNVTKPVPQIAENLSLTYVECNVFGFLVDKDSVYDAEYCLKDMLGNILQCNTTGIFTGIPLGDYCVTIHDLCADTTIIRCISQRTPRITNDMAASITKLCSNFNAAVTSINLGTGAVYTVYTEDSVIVASNTTGIFNGLAYGKYYVAGKAVCPDTTVFRAFNAVPDKPAGTLALTVSNERCTVFDLQAGGLSNLASAVYILKDQLTGNTLDTKTTPKFTDLPYGSYCIEVKNGCFDTTIVACKVVSAPVRTSTVTASMSCNYGTTKLNITANVYPVVVSVYNPASVMVGSASLSAAGSIDNIPNLPAGEVYTVKCEWTCGTPVTTTVAPVVAFLNHTATVQQLCPGSSWPNGSGTITANVTTNAGALTVRIIKKDGVTINVTPNSVIGSAYNFINLGPGTYDLQYSASDGCSRVFNETVTIGTYLFPDLNKTSAFQCDLNGFSVGAYVNNGVGPFSYEIINSTPSTPSIVSPPQASPVFNIDNGTEYQLIRLRALDACGNATLGDVSILPLASNQIKGITDNCIGTQVTLKIDTMVNSTVVWTYKKNQTDVTSTHLGTGFSYQINPFTYSDIGYYYCNVTMNDGCVVRTYEFHLDGACHGVLPVLLVDLKGKIADEKPVLEWTIDNGKDLKEIYIERNEGEDFKQIAKTAVKASELDNKYRFIDEQAGSENQYRLRLVFQDGKSVYSKTVRLNLSAKNRISVYPNPATEFITVDFGSGGSNSFMVELVNVVGQKTVKKETVTSQKHTIRRTTAMPAGMYLLKVTNQKTSEVNNYKVVIK